MNIKTQSNKPDPELILIFDGGKVFKETVGFEGKSCKEVTEFIETALKAKNQKLTLKPEYLRNRKTEGPLRLNA